MAPSGDKWRNKPPSVLSGRLQADPGEDRHTLACKDWTVPTLIAISLASDRADSSVDT